jgi:hypothetical protein
MTMLGASGDTARERWVRSEHKKRSTRSLALLESVTPAMPHLQSAAALMEKDAAIESSCLDVLYLAVISD